MRVLLTGGTGFVGSHAVAALQAAGHELRLLARSPERVERILGPRGLTPLDVAVGDMTREEDVGRALDGCDAVIHTAATMYGGDEVLRANVAGVHHVLGLGEKLGLDPIVYVSSVAALFPPAGPVMRAEDPVSGVASTYGRSKTEGERYARERQAAGVPVVTVYPGGVYGPEDPVLGETMKGLRDRVRYGWPKTRGGNACVDVRDLAAVLAAVLEPGQGPRRFMAGGNFLPWADEADRVEKLIGRRVRRVWAPPALVLATGRLLDLAKRVVDFEYPLTYEAAQYLLDSVACDSEPTLQALGLRFRPPEETLGDAIRWLYEVGELDARFVPALVEAGATRP